MARVIDQPSIALGTSKVIEAPLITSGSGNSGGRWWFGGVGDRLGRNQGCCRVNRLSGDNTRMETDQVLPMLNNWSALNESN
jgi:hypothetical protein